MSLSVVIICRNEAVNIRRCLASVAWCDDVLVVDDFSTDETGEIASSRGARVLQHLFTSFAEQRNWALEHGGLRNEWVLMLDADEAATPAFQRDLAECVAAADEQTAAFAVCRKTMLDGRWLKYSDGFPVWIMRVIRRGRARFASSGHGEVPVPPVEGRVLRVREPIVHDPFSKGLSDWLERHNHYSSREAALELNADVPIVWSELFCSDAARRRRALRNLGRRVPCRPLLRFAWQYVWKRGFLDGRAGLTFSTLMAMYEAMIVLKRRELQNQDKARE
ncbi:MAG: glycosyltransferase family 2 protein [Pirellulaceae bacterium]|nr:glycosyltransferase family 2 protein [Pirellulaceae bacterium]